MSFLDKHENFLSKYNRILIFLFFILFFVEDVTRYKHILFYLMIATALCYLCLDSKKVIEKLKHKEVYFTLLFSVALYVSVSYSLNPKATLKFINNNLLNYGILSLGLLFPIILYKEKLTDISKLVILGYLTALVVLLLIESASYLIAYQHGVLPFTTYNFRNISDALTFFFPILPILWYILPKNKLIYFYILCVVFLFILLGTLSRGAWLAIAVSGGIFLCFKRPWKLIASVIGLALIGLISLKMIYPETTNMLFFKLEQTDSSNRYTNGTQGTAFELIIEQPFMGYGIGDSVYHEKYNSVVAEHPMWAARTSIGPHNIWLFVWFGAGIFGLASFTLLTLSMGYTSYQGIRRSVENPLIYFSFLALFISLIGFYVVRGMFEQVDLKPLGLILGFLIAMINAIPTKRISENNG
ncbi:O-antigen ligase RfaL [Providencia alcalifaciens]|uniref:O-antigen ligase RfaL n=1 Tax=Providencia alcalifaciens TaxID=126385 RepID=UPI00044FA1EE|nr:O-antigen ligase RfaL [Providencia alcalifaciens]ETT08244.1 O-antigen ligase [Providencia alcalifaciens F90-2004]EUC95064.1 O-antigen ligase [Providencia alcalifaciens PAL-2]MTB33249.1 O-antigen ligase RfaL [Providencia alcalifaciens]MTC98567.1 O-antigen ligase RfaL [Providencia alcalifaciens]